MYVASLTARVQRPFVAAAVRRLVPLPCALVSAPQLHHPLARIIHERTNGKATDTLQVC